MMAHLIEVETENYTTPGNVTWASWGAATASDPPPYPPSEA